VTRKQSRICAGGIGSCKGDDEEDPPDIYCWDCGCSPIIVDVSGDGIHLTDAAGGVNFDINADGGAERRAWMTSGSDDAWLTLDRNGNGTIDNGKELFNRLNQMDSSH
jgi:hypothetical protein